MANACYQHSIVFIPVDLLGQNKKRQQEKKINKKKQKNILSLSLMIGRCTSLKQYANPTQFTHSSIHVISPAWFLSQLSLLLIRNNPSPLSVSILWKKVEDIQFLRGILFVCLWMNLGNDYCIYSMLCLSWNTALSCR